MPRNRRRLESIMDSCDIIAATSAIACSIEQCHSREETVILAKVFFQLSTTLFTMLEIDKTCQIIEQKNLEKAEQTAEKPTPKEESENNDKKI